MLLSAPIYRLKRKAKTLARNQQIPLHQALDRVAETEGYNSWSLLVSQAPTQPGTNLLNQLKPGHLVLLGARPGHGKTLLSIELLACAMKQGRQGAFFTFEYHRGDIAERFAAIGVNIAKLNQQFLFEDSDAICADLIIQQLGSAPPGTVVVVDYLQLLDQKRANPDLMEQVQLIRGFAQQRGLIVVFISQIDRRFDTSGKAIPTSEDIRLPNPLSLQLFDVLCFLNDGQIKVVTATD